MPWWATTTFWFYGHFHCQCFFLYHHKLCCGIVWLNLVIMPHYGLLAVQDILRVTPAKYRLIMVMSRCSYYLSIHFSSSLKCSLAFHLLLGFCRSNDDITWIVFNAIFFNGVTFLFWNFNLLMIIFFICFVAVFPYWCWIVFVASVQMLK